MPVQLFLCRRPLFNAVFYKLPVIHWYMMADNPLKITVAYWQKKEILVLLYILFKSLQGRFIAGTGDLINKDGVEFFPGIPV